MSPLAYPAAKLSEHEKRNLAILALAGYESISELAAQHDVSRKYVYKQVDKVSNSIGCGVRKEGTR